MKKYSDDLYYNADFIRNHITYYPDTGEWSKNSGYRRQVLTKGYKESTGYLTLWVCGKRYLSHRLAWLYMTGVWPNSDIDHRDGDKLNNKWSNLRLASKTENKRNREIKRPKHDLPRGVSTKSGKTFRSRIKINGIQIELGSYESKEEASEVYMLAADMLHGDFAFHRCRTKEPSK